LSSTIDIVNEPRAYHSPRQFKRLGEELEAMTGPPEPKDFHFYVEQFAIHGMSSAFSRLMEVSEGAVNRNRSLGRFAQSYATFLMSSKTALGDAFEERLNRSLLSDAPQLVQRGDTPSDRLVIVLPTYYNNAMVSFPLLDAYLGTHGHDALYLKATHSQIPFYSGFFGVGSSIDWVNHFLLNLCEQRGYQTLSLIGASSGGFMALWLGAKLGAETVCVYGADTKPTMRSKLLSPKHMSRMATEEEITDMIDLGRIGQIHVYAGNLRSRDVECLTLLEGLDNVEGHLIRGVGHMVLNQLLSKGYGFENIAG
jgi:hypothetical protein